MLITDVDYCIIVSSYCDTLHLNHHLRILDSLFGLGPHIHVVDAKPCKEREEMYRAMPVSIHRMPKLDQPCRSGFVPASLHSYRIAKNWDWCIRNCGDRAWWCIAHADIIYYGPYLLNYYLQSVQDDVGLIGTFNSAAFVRREAYHQTDIKFTPIMGVRCTDRGHNDGGKPTYRLQWADDGMPSNGGVNLIGLDTADLFTVAIQSLGWRYIPKPPEMSWAVHHVGGGSGYMVPYAEEFIRSRDDAVKQFNKAMSLEPDQDGLAELLVWRRWFSLFGLSEEWLRIEYSHRGVPAKVAAARRYAESRQLAAR